MGNTELSNCYHSGQRGDGCHSQPRKFLLCILYEYSATEQE